MVKPPPISLRIRSAEASRRARELLRKLDEEHRLRRRIKWQATRATISIREMVALAAPELEKMLPSDRARWRAECERVQSFLERIKARGV